MKQAVLKITGKVQGVFFRASARDRAESLNLNGYAENLPDGGVGALVQGEEDAIQEFIKWCKEGPSSAQVKNVETDWQSPGQTYDAFEIY